MQARPRPAAAQPSLPSLAEGVVRPDVTAAAQPDILAASAAAARGSDYTLAGPSDWDPTYSCACRLSCHLIVYNMQTPMNTREKNVPCTFFPAFLPPLSCVCRCMCVHVHTSRMSAGRLTCHLSPHWVMQWAQGRPAVGRRGAAAATAAAVSAS